MIDRWHDWTERVRIGDDRRAHLTTGPRPVYSACGKSLWDYSWERAPDGMPLCVDCQRAIDRAKKEAQ